MSLQDIYQFLVHLQDAQISYCAMEIFQSKKNLTAQGLRHGVEIKFVQFCDIFTTTEPLVYFLPSTEAVWRHMKTT